MLAALSAFFVVQADAITSRHRFERAKDARPNILFLMTDSMDGRVVDPMAAESKVVDMPFLNFLGNNGANFIQSYSHNPMCVPSRTSMMTGRSSYELGIWGNRGGLAASPKGVLDDNCVKNFGDDQCTKWAKAQGYPEHVFSVFESLGYKVHMDGRLHIGAGMLNEKDHEGKVEGRQSCDAFDEMRLGEVTRSADIRESVGDTMRAVYLENAKVDGGDTNFGLADWGAVAGCQRFIDELPSPSQLTQPFFLHCSLNLPHYTYSTNSTWLAKVHDEKIVLPTWPKGFPNKWHPYDSFMSIAKGVDIDFEEKDIRKLIRIYYAMMAESDFMLQSIWESLTAKGYGLDNTYVIYVSDHGEMKFEHRQVMKASMFEGSVRVPMQLAGPGIKKGQRIDTHLTSLLDVFPTLLDMAQEGHDDRYKSLAGKSLLAAAGGQSVAPTSMQLAAGKDNRDLVVSNYNWVEGPTGAYMVRSGHYKMVTYGHTYKAFKDYLPQLYDMEADPDEMHDIAEKNPNIVALLDKRLRTFMDPEVVDKWVMEDDFDRLKARFHGSVDPSDSEVQRLVKKQDREQFSNWVTEAKNMFSSR